MRDRLMQMRYVLAMPTEPWGGRRTAMFIDGHLYRALADRSRSPAARVWRLRLRLRRKFKTDLEGWQ